ncbi:MAG: hypothetical protein FWE90_12875 [Defluviitaleaceae bacterium]|nr:hypothetical protein [Defluviitaleaceae bacterium]
MTLLKNKKALMFTVLVAGALVMLLGRFFTAQERVLENGDSQIPIAYVPQTPPADVTDIRAVEERLEEFFTLVEGAGKVRVMVGFTAHRETVFAMDIISSESLTREEDAQGGNREMRQTSDQSQTVLVPDRNGSSRPLVLRESEPRIEGIVIIAEGGDSPLVRAELTRAAQAVLGLDAHRIQVLTMRSE